MNARPTFLIADDNANSRFLTLRAVAAEFDGCRVLEAATTEEALARAIEVNPDVVLTDHHLGCAEGPVLIAQCRAAGIDS